MRSSHEIKTEFERWMAMTSREDAVNKELHAELSSMDDQTAEDAFYRDLAFGTGGLRGVIGAGTNRMNIYTVAKASQGLANYINKRFADAPSIAIAYDSRIKSDLFSKTAASVFAANGVKAYIYPELMPTPCLSYAVRALECSAGIVVTASHNPSKYNGYKVYGSDGCQITTEAAADILAEIEALDIFDDVASCPFDKAIETGAVEYIDESVYTGFINEIKGQSVLFGDDIDRNVAIVYSPLNGTGLKPVTRALSESGFTNITVVEEQRLPDGNFPTCPYPNPEIRKAMELGLKYCKKTGADLLLATDPDADRCGIAVKDGDDYKLVTGNEVGLLLLDFICSQRVEHGKMPENPVFVKTIVTMDLAEKIAEHYGVQTVNVLTGFKFIGEVIGKMEAKGREKDYICGFEESYGYLTGTYVRDKDAVNAAFMICEMFAYYKTRGISLLDKLNELYSTYGYCLNTLHSYQFEGAKGMMKMQDIMSRFRKISSEQSGDCVIAGLPVIKTSDYINSIDGLPKSNVIKYSLEGGTSVVVRPSGTEPKLKTYISVTASDRESASELEKKIVEFTEELILN